MCAPFLKFFILRVHKKIGGEVEECVTRDTEVTAEPPPINKGLPL